MQKIRGLPEAYVLLTIVLLFGVGVINAHVRKETFQNLFVTNAAMAGISGNEALKNTQLVTSNRFTILFDKVKKTENNQGSFAGKD